MPHRGWGGSTPVEARRRAGIYGTSRGPAAGPREGRGGRHLATAAHSFRRTGSPRGGDPKEQALGDP